MVDHLSIIYYNPKNNSSATNGQMDNDIIEKALQFWFETFIPSFITVK